MNRTSTCVIIPAYNEYASLGKVLTALRSVPGISEVIVVDDASTDSTFAYAQKKNATVLRLSRRGGKGKAIQMGLRYARDRNYDVIVLMDADGQHHPASIPRLVSALQGTTMIIGSRYIHPTRPVSSKVRRVAGRIISTLLFISYRVRIFDPTSGFRVIHKKALPALIAARLDGFPELSALPIFIMNNWRIKEISVEMFPRFAGTSSITMTYGLYGMTIFFAQSAYFMVKNCFFGYSTKS